jgi:hypothetical protein
MEQTSLETQQNFRMDSILLTRKEIEPRNNFGFYNDIIISKNEMNTV